MMKPKDWSPQMTIDWSSVLIEPKMDGIRACFQDGQFISYNGKPLYNVDAIVEELNALQVLKKGDFFDGELWSQSGGWEKTISVVKSSKTKKPIGDVRFYVFDYVLCDQADMILQQRRDMIDKLWMRHRFNLDHVVGTCWEMVESKKEFLTSYRNYVNLGFEGAMIKQLDAPYLWMKRHKSWLRHKPTTTEDVTVVNVKEGKGKYVGMLGAFICMDQQKKPICVSGFTDQQRKEYWKKKTRLKGLVIEVKYYKRTQQGNMYAAQFIREREDKGK